MTTTTLIIETEELMNDVRAETSDHYRQFIGGRITAGEMSERLRFARHIVELMMWQTVRSGENSRVADDLKPIIEYLDKVDRKIQSIGLDIECKRAREVESFDPMEF